MTEISLDVEEMNQTKGVRWSYFMKDSVPIYSLWPRRNGAFRGASGLIVNYSGKGKEAEWL